MPSVGSPHALACDEVFAAQSLPDRYSGICENLEQLRELWQIDQVAYGDLSLSFEQFSQWWWRYPYGSRNLYIGDRIVASIGLYPFPTAQLSAFASGEIKEAALVPTEFSLVEQNRASDWYWSGIVIVPEWQGRGLMLSLLRSGIGCWSSSGHLRFPLRILALGQTQGGIKLLEYYQFQQVRSAAAMPDGCPLYEAVFTSLEELRSRLRIRSV